MLWGTAMSVITKEHSDLQSARKVADNLHNDGNLSYLQIRMTESIICDIYSTLG